MIIMMSATMRLEQLIKTANEHQLEDEEEEEEEDNEMMKSRTRSLEYCKDLMKILEI